MNSGVGPAVVDVLQNDALVWVGRFASRAAILSAVEDAPVGSNDVSGLDDRQLAIWMRLGTGDRAQAQDLFGEYVVDVRDRQRVEPQLRIQLDYLEEYAAAVGLTMPSEDRAQ